MGSYGSFRREVEQRCFALRQLSSDELLLRARTRTDTLRFGWSTGTISLLVEERAPGLVRVIVQGFLRFPAWSPAARVALDGFDKHADGSMSDVPDDELAEFS